MTLQTAICTIAMGVTIASCSAAKNGTPPAAPSDQAQQQPASESAQASIEISYAQKGDHLTGLTVTKYDSAEVLQTADRGGRTGAEIVRFGGGVPLWAIHGGALLGGLPLIGNSEQLAVSSVKYGVTPAGFTQRTPTDGPPEPLDSQSYYIVEVDRESGAPSFQAMRLRSDGAIETYDADPRVGSSFALCCNVSANFVSSAEPSDSQPAESP